MSATAFQYHSSVRHYHSPFPLSHRNSRPFPSPTSNQGPWGANHHTEKVATSPKSASFDRRNQSHVPLSTGDAQARKLHHSTAMSPLSASRSSVYTDPLQGSMMSLAAKAILDQSASSIPDVRQIANDLVPLVGDATSRMSATNRAESADYDSLHYCGPHHSTTTDPTLSNIQSQPNFERDAMLRTLGGSTTNHGQNYVGHEDYDKSDRFHLYDDYDDDDYNGYDYSHLDSGAVDTHRGRGAGAYSDMLMQESLHGAVPGNYDPPTPLRLAQEKPMASPQRRRAPAKVAVGYVYKSCNVDGFNAPTHVQIPMGYRIVNYRPQIPAKVNQHCPWKPMDQQDPLPTLEPKTPRRCQPYSPGDASLRFASMEDQHTVKQQQLQTANSSPRRSGTHHQNTAHAYTLHDYASAADADPMKRVASTVGSEYLDGASPFETSRRQFPQRHGSNVPMSPNHQSRDDEGSAGASPRRSFRNEVESIHEHDAVPFTGASSASRDAQPQPRASHVVSSPATTNGSYQATLRNLNTPPSHVANLSGGFRPSRLDDEDEQQQAEQNPEIIARGRGRTGPFMPSSQVLPVPAGWTATTYGLSQQKVNSPSPQRRRAPAKVAVGYVYKSCNVDGFNAPTHVQIPMGYRIVNYRPQIPAKVNQHCPWKPMDQQDPLPTLEPAKSDNVERLAATPLITEVDERLAAQGLGSLLDIRLSSDEKIAAVLKALGFGPSDRMTILWELRRKHPLPARQPQQ